MSGSVGFGIAAEALAVGGALASGQGILTAVGLGSFAAFGGIVFALLGSPEGLTRQHRTNYAKLPILNGRAVIQPTYDDLAMVRLTIKLHELWLGSGGPEQAFAMLDQQRLSHTPEPLVFGGAGAPEGTYVIAGLSADDKWRYAGVSQWIDATLRLTEWAPSAPLGSLPAQPPTPPAGIIGTPGAASALFATGATIGAPMPTLGFATTAASVIARMGAP